MAPRPVPTAAPAASTAATASPTASGSAADAALVTPPGLSRHQFRAMGTSVTVLLPTDRAAEAERVIEIFARWEATCTRFDPGSELSQVNRAAGRPVVVSDLLFQVIDAARRAARSTDGLFDPTLLHPLMAIGYDRDFGAIAAGVPAPPRGSTPVTGGWRQMTLDAASRTVCLPPNAGLDLGGIAKGMAVDAALTDLAARDIGSAAIDAGGDLGVLGLPPGSPAWTIEVEGPDRGHVVSLRAGAIATSSLSRRRWRQGGTDRHHLIDPRTSLPSDAALWSVTVAAPTCAQAEVAAKAAFLLRPDAGGVFLADRGLGGLFLLPDGTEVRAGSWLPA